MKLQPGARLGAYEIVAPIDAGGMGEVYQARDTRLDRTVAIKVLPDASPASLDSVQRFEREARAISQLSHPHICQLFDVGREGATPFLVMEMVTGETLAARLAKGPLPFEEVVRYARQIAGALDASHRAGIVHRDLKPGNVMLPKSGIKLLDFGLAKSMIPFGDAAVAVTEAPKTATGNVVGTVPYMAPEQLEGRAADARSDIYALGLLIYEMTTGDRYFGNGSRTVTPAALGRIVRGCLARDPDDRWQSAHDVSLQLDGLTADEPSAEPTPKTRTVWIPWLVAAIAVVIALANAVWSRGSRSVAQPTASPAIRFAIPPPAGGAFWDNFENAPLAMSPDGSQLAFIATDAERVQRVWLRPLVAIDAHAVPDTDGASGVLWSPDSRSIAFFAEGRLKRIDLPGGAAVTLCEYKGSPGMSGSWGRGGDILFASVTGDAIYRVPATGGTPAVERKRDSAHGEQRAGFPWYLPDGRRYLYSTRLAKTARVMLSEEGREPRPILEVTTNAQFVEPDYLVFVRDGTLIAQRFDADRATVVGAAFSIAASVRYFYSTAAARFATAPGGAIAYHTFFDEERLVWVDRTGAETGTFGTPGLFISLRISPDGGRVLFSRAQPQLRTFDLWTADLARGGELRLTSDPTSEVNGLWHPDGRSIYFSVDRDGAPHVYRKDLTTGREVEVVAAGGLQTAEDFIPDGRTLVFSERLGASADLWTQPIDGGPPAPLLQTRFSEAQVRFSPDGRYIAFASNETGRNETYVSAYPPTGEKAAISLAGGTQPRWSHDGRELFFVGADRRLMVVPIRTAPTLSVGTPTALFRLPGRRTWKDYDVSADGRRFLAIVTDVLGDERPLTLVTNWKAEVPH